MSDFHSNYEKKIEEKVICYIQTPGLSFYKNLKKSRFNYVANQVCVNIKERIL